jgi:hypothetical protein
MKRFILIVLVIAVTGCASKRYSGDGKLPKSCSKARHKYYNRMIEI